MRFGGISLFIAAVVVSVNSAEALTLQECTRTTHISHGGEDMHVDLGEGRVMWRDWWSQEGTSTDYVIMDCAPGDALRFRTAEDNISDRAPFDRTEAALKVVDLHQKGARVFATLERMSQDLGRKARDVQLATLSKETCACAAVYPDLRGDKMKFSLPMAEQSKAPAE